MNLDANINNQIFRKDYKPVIAKNRHLASLAGVRLKALGTDLYVAGLVLAKNSVDGYFYPYANGGASGTGTAVCVLMEDITDPASLPSPTRLGRGIFSGELLQDNLVGLDAGAKTSLGARSYQASDGVNILKF